MTTTIQTTRIDAKRVLETARLMDGNAEIASMTFVNGMLVTKRCDAPKREREALAWVQDTLAAIRLGATIQASPYEPAGAR